LGAGTATEGIMKRAAALAVTLATALASLLLGLSIASLEVTAQAAEDAVGVWLNPENQSNVEFYKCGEGLCAKITKLATGGATTDEKNTEPGKRARPILGLVILDGAKKSGPSKWSGNLYNPTDGKTYAGSVAVKAKDTLELSGCVALVLCRTTSWTRVK
jgi:uncharacterized protein (DUF2147 family)